MISTHVKPNDEFYRMSRVYPSDLRLSLNSDLCSGDFKHYHLKTSGKHTPVAFTFTEPVYRRSNVALIRKSLRGLQKCESVDFNFNRIFSIKAYKDQFSAKRLNKQLYRAMSDVKTQINFEMYTPVSKDRRLFENFIRRIKNQVGLGVVKVKVDTPQELHRIQDFLSSCFKEQRHQKIRLEICIDLSFRFTQLIDTWMKYIDNVGSDFCKGIHRAYFIRNDFLDANCLEQMLRIINKFDNLNDHFTFSLLTSDKEEVASAVSELRTLHNFMKMRKNPRISIDLRENGCYLGTDQTMEVPSQCENLTLEWQSAIEPKSIKIDGVLKQLRVLRIDVKGPENWEHCNTVINSAPALEELELISTDDNPHIFEPLGLLIQKLSNLEMLKALELQLLVKAPYTPEIFSNICNIKRLETFSLRIDHSKKNAIDQDEAAEEEESKCGENLDPAKGHLEFIEEALMRLSPLSNLTNFTFEAASADRSTLPHILQIFKRNRLLTQVKLVLLNPQIRLTDLDEIIEYCRKFFPMDAALEIHLLNQENPNEREIGYGEKILKRSFSLGECEVRIIYEDFDSDLGLD